MISIYYFVIFDIYEYTVIALNKDILFYVS